MLAVSQMILLTSHTTTKASLLTLLENFKSAMSIGFDQAYAHGFGFV